MPEHPPRRDRSAAVKDEIRAAAARLFTERGFESTGIRDIAAAADVNPAIVIRHFGSKETLFVETVDGSGALKAMIEGPVDELGHRVVHQILMGRRRGGLSVFGTVVRASGKADIRSSLQASMIERFVTPIIPLIEREDAELRAHLFAAQLVGLMTALVVYDDEYLRSAPVDEVVELYGGGLQRLLTGPSESEASRSRL